MGENRTNMTFSNFNLYICFFLVNFETSLVSIKIAFSIPSKPTSVATWPPLALNRGRDAWLITMIQYIHHEIHQFLLGMVSSIGWTWSIEMVWLVYGEVYMVHLDSCFGCGKSSSLKAFFGNHQKVIRSHPLWTKKSGETARPSYGDRETQLGPGPPPRWEVPFGHLPNDKARWWDKSQENMEKKTQWSW